MSKWENDPEIEIFREYLRIPSVHPDVNYEPCVKFLRKQALSLGLPISVHYTIYPEKPFVIITWLGTEPDLPSILLNSHMDVVAVYEEHWSHPPFAAEIDEEGKIFARGTQDTKNIGTQYLGAIRALLAKGITLRRTVHVMFVPDEEISTEYGMKKIVTTSDFKELNVGFVFDEGAAWPRNLYLCFYGERSSWHVYFNCSGTTGHGSVLHRNTAGEKVRYIIDKFMNFRAAENNKLKDNPKLCFADVTTVNLTIANGGVQINVVPPTITIGFDVRLALDVDHDEFKKMLSQWCDEAGGNIDIDYKSCLPNVEPTVIDDTNPFWIAFKSVIVDDLNRKLIPMIGPGRSDCTFIRPLGIPAIGFSPMRLTPNLLHAHNEYLQADIYLEGIEVYQKILAKVANV